MIIAISGKIGSGKDTVANMIRGLDANFRGQVILDALESPDGEAWLRDSEWEVKRFADKIKDTVCLWLGCTREQLEDREFKEKPLGEQWHVWKVHHDLDEFIFRSEAERDDHMRELKERNYDVWEDTSISDEILTPRKLMQLLGTEAGRHIIHPDIWVNALFADYTEVRDHYEENGHTVYKDKYPDWIIPDVRFPNELDGIRKRDSVTIRVERDTELRFPELWKDFQDSDMEDWEDYLKAWRGAEYDKIYHRSETSLDHIKNWDIVIQNNGSLEDLLWKVRTIYKDLQL